MPSHQCSGSELADDERQLAIAGHVEGEGHVTLPGLLRLGDMTVVGGVAWTVSLERIEGEDHVLGRDRLAILPFRLGAQPIGRLRALPPRSGVEC